MKLANVFVVVRILGLASVTLGQTAPPPMPSGAKPPIMTQSPAEYAKTVTGGADLAVSPDLVLPVSELKPMQIELFQKKLLDWGELTHYRLQNAQTPAVAPGQARVVFMGDSIIEGWKRFGQFFPGKPYLDRGISGETTPQMVLRFRQDVIELRPTVVVILAGLNDIAGNTGPRSNREIEDNFRTMVDLAQGAHIRVVLCSILPASSLWWNPGVDPRGRIVELNSWLQSYAAERHLVYIDYYHAMVNSEGGIRPELAADKTVHPNRSGFDVMEPIAEAGIAKALSAPAP
jgi:acyl-CoA thioesterase-1